jgi:HK97 family phage portal protein
MANSGFLSTVKSALGFKTEAKALSLTDPESFLLFGGVTAATGAVIGPASAMRVPAVACAVSLISETVGTLPVKLFDRDTRQPAKDHPAYRLAHDEANPWTSAERLRTDLTTDALLHGHGYSLVIADQNGAPLELMRLDPSAVSPRADSDGEPFYLLSTASGQVRYPFASILHVSAFGGTSPITLGREAIALASAFEGHMGSLFANGGRPSGIIKSPKVLDVAAKRKLADSWFSTHSGRNAGGTAVLDEAMEYQALSATLADSQFAENRLEQIREIARVFRVPPTMLFELSRGTWSNTEEMARQFLTITLKPWLASWSWAYARALLTPEERKRFYFEFITDDFLTTDHAARATAYSQYRAMGAMTANEVRGGLNLSPLPEGDALQNPFTTTGAAPAANPEEIAA